MTKAQAGHLGGQALVAKYGSGYMAHIGSLGFWATVEALAQRQQIPLDYRGNAFRNLLTNLKAKKGGKS